MAFILDTNILIEMEKKNHSVIEQVDRLSELHHQKPHIASLSVSELFYGTLSQPIRKQVASLNKLRNYVVLNSSISSSIMLANIDNISTKTGRKIPPFDLFIASIAIDNDMHLVTLDKHFKNIPGLDVICINPQ